MSDERRIEGDVDAVVEMVPQLLQYLPVEKLAIVVFKQGRMVVAGAADIEAVGSAAMLTRSFGPAAAQGDALIAVAYTADATDALAVLSIFEAWCPVELYGAVHISASADELRAAGGNAAATRSGLDMPTMTRDEIIGQWQRTGTADGWQAALDEAQNRLNVNNVDVLSYVTSRLDEEASVEDGAWLMAVLADGARMDALWLALDHSTADQHFSWWRQIAVMTDSAEVLPAVILSGYAAWISGNGFGVNWALDRAELIPGSSDNPLIKTLTLIVEQAIDPKLWRELRHDLITG